MENQNNIIPFEGKEIRKIWHDEQWYFSVVDVIAVLTDSPIPKTYWSKLKTKIKAESESYPNTVQLKLMAADGKNYKTDCTNTEGRMAGNARRTFEKDRGKPVISTDNYLTLNKSDKSDELLEGDK